MLPIISGLSCLALMAALSVETWLRFLVWLALGLAAYVFYGRSHSKLSGAAQARAVDEEMGEAEMRD